MANFFIPSYEDAARYANTTEGGFLHPWKMTIGLGSGEYGVVGLKGGYDKTEPLKVVSNNPGVVRLSEPPGLPLSPGAWPNADRFITVVGERGGTTMIEARGPYGVWCTIQIEVTGGFSSAKDEGPFIPTNQWEFGFEKDLNPLGYTLPNGVRIPLPPRGPLWPKRESRVVVGRSVNPAGQAIYSVVLTPFGHDSYWARKWLIDKVADKGIEKVVGFMLTGMVAVAVASAVSTVLIPNDVAADSVWEGKCTEGPVYGVSVGFNT